MRVLVVGVPCSCVPASPLPLLGQLWVMWLGLCRLGPPPSALPPPPFLSLSSGLEPHSQAQLLPGQGRVTTHCQGGWVQSPASSSWWVTASRTRGAPWCLLPALLARSLSFCWPALLKEAQDQGERMVEVSWSWPRAGGEGRGEWHWVWGRQSCHLAT